VKKPAGYQAALACLTPWVNGEAPSALTCLSLGPPAFGLLAYGNGSGLVVVDHLQQKGRRIKWLLPVWFGKTEGETSFTRFGLVKQRGKQVLRGKKKFELVISLFAQFWTVLGIRSH